MPPARILAPCDIYAKQMVMLGLGEALWQPAPLHNYQDGLQIADLGFVRRGHFQVVHRAGAPISPGAVPGQDIPLGFVAPIRYGDVVHGHRGARALSTTSMNEIGLSATLSANATMLSAGAEFAFNASRSAGACLITRFKTISKDAEFVGHLRLSFLRNYKSWLAFAQERDPDIQLSDLRLVTGIDLTKDWAMLAYSENNNDFTASFQVSDPAQAGSAGLSAWGSWKASTSVHNNWGPQEVDEESDGGRQSITDSQDSAGQSASGFTQCVFYRGYRMRTRGLGKLWPDVMKAAAGPEDLGSGERSPDHGGPVPSFDYCDDSGNEVEVLQIEGSSSDPLEPCFDWIFERSDAKVAILHDSDFEALLKIPTTTGAKTVSEVLNRTSPAVVVDSDGVGTLQPHISAPRMDIITDESIVRHSSDPHDWTPARPLPLRPSTIRPTRRKHINTDESDADSSPHSVRPTSYSLKRKQNRKGGNPRLKSCCITCRIRRKKCDEAKPVCTACSRLRIECLGYGERRPEWLRDPSTLEDVKARIKKYLRQQGMVKGAASTTQTAAGPGPGPDDADADVLRLTPSTSYFNTYREPSQAPSSADSDVKVGTGSDERHNTVQASSPCTYESLPPYSPSYAPPSLPAAPSRAPRTSPDLPKLHIADTPLPTPGALALRRASPPGARAALLSPALLSAALSPYDTNAELPPASPVGSIVRHDWPAPLYEVPAKEVSAYVPDNTATDLASQDTILGGPPAVLSPTYTTRKHPFFPGSPIP